jgi:hypothetical protein
MRKFKYIICHQCEGHGTMENPAFENGFTQSEMAECSGQLKLATALEFFQYRFSDSFGGNPPL